MYTRKYMKKYFNKFNHFQTDDLTDNVADLDGWYLVYDLVSWFFIRHSVAEAEVLKR